MLEAYIAKIRALQYGTYSEWGHGSTAVVSNSREAGGQGSGFWNIGLAQQDRFKGRDGTTLPHLKKIPLLLPVTST